MDLVAGVRKEGSRGGRAEFKWTDVTTSTHRENYLGHSLMAPVGRWQKNKDLSWYAKGDKAQSEEALSAAAEARREEIRKVKEAEQDALSEALGFGPAPKGLGQKGNANEVPLGGDQAVESVIKGIREGEEGEGKGGKGLGFGSFSGGGASAGGQDVLAGEGTAGAAGNGTAEERALKRIMEEEKAKKRRRRDMRMTREERGDGIITITVTGRESGRGSIQGGIQGREIHIGTGNLMDGIVSEATIEDGATAGTGEATPGIEIGTMSAGDSRAT